MSTLTPKYTDSARYKCLEYLKKNTFDLYLCYCGIQNCAPAHSYGPTQRTEYLLHYIISGKGTYTVKDKTYELHAHQAFLICPDEITFYKADSDDPWYYIWVAFNGVKAKTYLSYANLDTDHRICEFPDSELLLQQVQNMLNARELTYANELKRESSLFLFLSHLIEHQHHLHSTTDTYDYSYQVYVEHALEFIEHNYDKNIKIQDLASYIGINRSYLTNSFKKVLNTSPQLYLLNYRLDKACQLLKTTNLTITEISRMIGYEDSLAFSKLFKRYRGTSPKNYRLEKESIIISNENKYS